jgi:hypothetical protein
MTGTCRTAALVCSLVLSFPLGAQERGAADAKSQVEPAEGVDAPNAGASSQPEYPESIDLSKEDKSDPASKAMRFSLGHEGSFRTAGAQDVVNNRSWLRIEYSKFFLDSLFVQIDSKLNGYWKNDHRARAEDKRALFESNTQEAFLQYSAAGGQTAIKAGVQRLIWGESEAGAITDEVSPRNFSELFFIPLEESRIGQFMLNVDHFSSSGDWSFFYVPNPKFNKYPKTGTAYYFDPFNGLAVIRDRPSDKKQHEYGTRWKKTFGKSDFSLMAASLIDNDHVLRMDGVSAAGSPLISRLQERFTLTGATFNYTQGDFLLKGEVGLKFPKRFNDAASQVVERNVIDSSLGATYSLGQSNTIGLEIVNSHVRNWNNNIVGVPRNTNSLVLNTNFLFFNDALSVNWLTIYSQPFSSYQSSVRTSYKWNDNTTFSVDAHVLGVPDKSSRLHKYRDQDQIAFRVQYQF